jgi:transcriptional regulator GlxA family with amidase domain
MRIGLIVPPGFAMLSFAPLSVFEAANGVLGKPFYEVHAVSLMGGRIPNSFGMELETERVTDGTFDTLLIGSPPEVRAQSLRNWHIPGQGHRESTAGSSPIHARAGPAPH